jgi:MFS family permease
MAQRLTELRKLRMSLRHERRRRVSSDDSPWSATSEEDGSPTRAASDSASADASSQADAGQRAYAAASRFDRQRLVHDLFPSRYLTIALVVIAGLSSVALVELLHAWSGSLASVLSDQEASALDLNTARNVSRWFSSMLLGLASLAAMFIYSLRRHRVDDYHGRYRVWIWTAIGCLLASMVETTSASTLAQGLCRRAAAACGVAETVAWPAALATVLSAIAIRLLVEVRRCRLAVAAGIASAVAFLLATAVDHGWLIHASGPLRTPLERGSWLVGYVLTLATFLLYARQVNREIEGLVVVAPPKARRPKAKKSVPVDTAQTRVDPPQKPSPLPRTDLDSLDMPANFAKTNAAASKHATASAPSPAKGGLSDRVLSRGERRRLRREAQA